MVEQITKGSAPPKLACFQTEDIRVALQQLKTTIHTLIRGYERNASDMNRSLLDAVKRRLVTAIEKLDAHPPRGGGKLKRRKSKTKRRRKSKTRRRRRR